eukprot:306366-Chlamydomonas_euryale.AAC.3
MCLALTLCWCVRSASDLPWRASVVLRARAIGSNRTPAHPNGPASRVANMCMLSCYGWRTWAVRAKAGVAIVFCIVLTRT